VGNDGETLVADSSTSTGLRYQVPVNVNPVLNSSMQVWQRGTSFSLAASTSAANGYTADRWDTVTGTNQACTISRQATGDTTNLPNIQYALRYQRNSGQTGTGQLNLAQSFESVNSIPYAGKVVTLSFYARAGANFSPTSNLLGVTLYSATSTDGNVLTGGFSGAATPISQNATLTTTWQRFTFTSATIATNATQLAPVFSFNVTGTAGAADYYEITGVQIEVGSVATPFKTYAGTIQGELAACQRYYQQYAGGLGVPYNGVANSATTLMTYLAIQPTMRTAATCTVGGTLYADDGYAGTVNAASPTVDFVDQYQGGGRFRIGGFSGMTTGRHYSFYYNTGYIGLSAEL
jgi:hypothetical protein